MDQSQRVVLPSLMLALIPVFSDKRKDGRRPWPASLPRRLGNNAFSPSQVEIHDGEERPTQVRDMPQCLGKHRNQGHPRLFLPTGFERHFPERDRPTRLFRQGRSSRSYFRDSTPKRGNRRFPVARTTLPAGRGGMASRLERAFPPTATGFSGEKKRRSLKQEGTAHGETIS